jgi:hypothetical protein
LTKGCHDQSLKDLNNSCIDVGKKLYDLLHVFTGSYETRSKLKVKMLKLNVGGRMLTRLLKKLPGELHKVAILAAHHMTLHVSWLGVAPTPLSRLDNSPCRRHL